MVSPSTPGPPLFLRTRFHAFSRLLRSHTSSMSWSSVAGRSVVRFAVGGSVPGRSAARGSPRRADAKARRCCVYWIVCRGPLMSRESYWPLPIVRAFGESLRPCGPWLFLPLSGQCLDRAGRRGSSTLPSADFCAPFRSSLDSLSPVHGTGRRSPGVSLTAFTAALPDLQPWSLMDVDFAISRPLVRPRMPRIRFLFVRSRLCFTLPPDPASRRRPCASLALRLHQAVQRTRTSKLPNMPGTRLNRSAVEGGSTRHH